VNAAQRVRLAAIEAAVAYARHRAVAIATKSVDQMSEEELIEEWRRLCRAPRSPSRPLSQADETELEAFAERVLTIWRARQKDDAARLLASGFWQQQGRRSA
jgi:hypothetical protein